MEIPEELVEEVVWMMHECFVEAEKVPDHDYFSVLHDYAGKSITLIGKAFTDGKLDEVLGVVGRGMIDYPRPGIVEVHWLECHYDGKGKWGRQFPFIALSPSGIPVEGKEEG